MVAVIDVHTHLHCEAFDADRPLAIARAREAGVRTMLLMGEGFEDNERVLEAARSHPELRPCLGFHPDQAQKEDYRRALAQTRERLSEIAAIGEVGLDFFKAREPEERGRQEEAFRAFVSLAIETGLPLSVHSRSTGARVIETLSQMGASRVCMHAFDGRASLAVDAAGRLGFFFSIPPSVVRSEQKQKLAARVPLSHLLLETDSPVLGAEPGARNEPAEILKAAAKVAELKRIPLDDVLRAAHENTLRLFPRLGDA